MVFQIEDYNEFIALLREHPDWIPQLRNLLLSDDFLALPGIVKILVETQQRSELAIQNLTQAQERNENRLERLETAVERLEAIVERLAQAQERSENRLERLAQVQERSENRLERLETAVERLEAIVERLAQAQESTEQKLNQLDNRVASLRGQALEQKYCQRAGAYFGRLMKKVKVISPDVLAECLEDILSPEEFQDALLIDLVVKGRPRARVEIGEIWLAIEVSAVIDRNDVIRSRRRAELIQRQGIPTLAVVAGENLTEGGEAEASAQKVAVVQNGTIKFWEEAIAG